MQHVVDAMSGPAPGAPGYGRTGGPYAVAHRGGAGLAVENTLEAFARSHALGLRYLETDVRATTDGVCALFHDSTLRRLTGSSARIRDLSWAQLRAERLPGDHRVPRLEELLDAFPDGRLMIDLKDPRAIGPLARALRRSRAQARVCLAGGADRWLADARAVIGSDVRTAMGWESLARLAAAARLGMRPRGVVPAQFVHLPLRLSVVPVFVERLVTMVHDLGAELLIWTVDDPGSMHRLLDLGVDGVITDRPDLLREVLVSRGAWGSSEPSPPDRVAA